MPCVHSTADMELKFPGVFLLLLLPLLLLVAILLQASVSFVAISYPFDGGGWFGEGHSFACGIFWGFGHGSSRWAC